MRVGIGRYLVGIPKTNCLSIMLQREKTCSRTKLKFNNIELSINHCIKSKCEIESSIKPTKTCFFKG